MGLSTRASARILATISIVAAIVACSVDRRLRVRTEPTGATVVLDGKELGRTPLDVHFTHYGVRRLRVEMGGYATIEKTMELRPPWYGASPFDVVTEVLLPLWRVDFHDESLALEPRRPPEAATAEELTRRGRETVDRARAVRRWVPGEEMPSRDDAPSSAPAGGAAPHAPR